MQGVFVVGFICLLEVCYNERPINDNVVSNVFDQYMDEPIRQGAI